MFTSRTSPPGQDRFLWVKGILFLIGIGLLLAGIRLEQSWLVWSAIAVLGIAFAFRFFSKNEDNRAE